MLKIIAFLISKLSDEEILLAAKPFFLALSSGTNQS
jgi:hypothetical protein